MAPVAAPVAPEASAGNAAPAFRRKECWAARDEFFACVHVASAAEGVSGPRMSAYVRHVASDGGRCVREGELFEERCPPSWVHHFILQRFGNEALKPNASA